MWWMNSVLFFVPSLWMFTLPFTAIWGAIVFPNIYSSVFENDEHAKCCLQGYTYTVILVWIGAFLGAILGAILILLWPITLIAVVIGTISFFAQNIQIRLKPDNEVKLDCYAN